MSGAILIITVIIYFFYVLLNAQIKKVQDIDFIKRINNDLRICKKDIKILDKGLKIMDQKNKCLNLILDADNIIRITNSYKYYKEIENINDTLIKIKQLRQIKYTQRNIILNNLNSFKNFMSTNSFEFSKKYFPKNVLILIDDFIKDSIHCN